jgi:hypothetical protein
MTQPLGEECVDARSFGSSVTWVVFLTGLVLFVALYLPW